MQEVVKGIIGKDLTNSFIKMLKEFKRLGYDDKEIYRNIKDLNDVSIMSLYLLATENNDNMAFYIKKSYDRVLNNRVVKFRESVNLDCADNYLKKLSKTEIINLAYHMKLYDLSSREYNKLSEHNKLCYKILNNYIKNMV